MGNLTKTFGPLKTNNIHHCLTSVWFRPLIADGNSICLIMTGYCPEIEIRFPDISRGLTKFDILFED